MSPSPYGIELVSVHREKNGKPQIHQVDSGEWRKKIGTEERNSQINADKEEPANLAAAEEAYPLELAQGSVVLDLNSSSFPFLSACICVICG